MIGRGRGGRGEAEGRAGKGWTRLEWPVSGRGMFGGIGKGGAGLGEDGWYQGEVGGLVAKGSTLEEVIWDDVIVFLIS